MKNSVALIAVATLATGLCANARAHSMSEAPSEVVKYSDLDATKVPDAVVLYHRIDAAASRVCGERERPGSFFVSLPWQRCYQTALRDAVAKINSPAVTAYAAAHGVLVAHAMVARGN